MYYSSTLIIQMVLIFVGYDLVYLHIKCQEDPTEGTIKKLHFRCPFCKLWFPQGGEELPY